MHPHDLAQERERRTRKGYATAARNGRRAYANATSDERMTLDQLAIACQARAVTADEALALIASIRDSQRTRALAQDQAA